MRKIFKRILIFLLSLFLIVTVSFDHRVTPYYELLDDDAFARYSNGKVYIGDNYFINNLVNIEKNDILIIDNRNSDDPSFKVLSSYKVNDRFFQIEILEILLEYERQKPTKWNRSLSSMKYEWFVHNLFYYFNYQINRTMDVDFNNNDEGIYTRKKVKEVIKNIVSEVNNNEDMELYNKNKIKEIIKNSIRN